MFKGQKNPRMDEGVKVIAALLFIKLHEITQT